MAKPITEFSLSSLSHIVSRNIVGDDGEMHSEATSPEPAGEAIPGHLDDIYEVLDGGFVIEQRRAKTATATMFWPTPRRLMVYPSWLTNVLPALSSITKV